MAQRKSTSRRKKYAPGSDRKKWIIGAAAVILVIVIVVVVINARRNAAEDADIAEGVTYLKNLEAADVSEVENDIQEKKLAEQAALKQQRLEELTSGDVDIWSLFSDYVIMGDSRAEGFSAYGYLPEDRVLAEKGDTIKTVDDHLEDIENLSPLYVFLCYGMNDISTGIISSTEEYKTLVQEQIEKIKDVAPNAEIYVNSIIPVTEAALAETPTLGDADEYNVVLQELCEEQGYYYVDNSEIAEEYSDLYEADGVHFSGTFYSYWASNMLMTVYDTQGES